MRPPKRECPVEGHLGGAAKHPPGPPMTLGNMRSFSVGKSQWVAFK